VTDVAVVGLGFGQEFVPIYQRHPDVGRVAIVDPDERRCAHARERFGAADTFASLDELLAGDGYDAVHILSPVAFHAEQSVAVLRSGRHCACAVPMATTLDDIERIVVAQAASGLAYMMMETAVYSRELLYMRDLFRPGELTYLRGFHLQDLHGFPHYWIGYPPMTYSTHALSPLLALADARVVSVQCRGSGRLTPEHTGDFANPFPVETALFALDRDDLIAEVTMAFFQVARAYQEGFSVYGDDLGVEWPTAEGGPLLVHRMLPVPTGGRGRPATVDEVDAPDRPDLVPPELHSFLRGHHGGSHPHLVHEFVRSIVEGRAPRIDAPTAAAWTAPGICGHASALQGGAEVAVPAYG
jgi:predicted dehydrogenase